MIWLALVVTWKWQAAEVGAGQGRAQLDGDMKDRPKARDGEKWRCGIMGRTSDPHKRGKNGHR